jgi:hypothetical protein
LKSKLKIKALRTALALLLCTGIFIFPAHAFAEGQNPNVAPPTVHAEIIGSLLRIQVSSGFFAVEAVYINGQRFNHRVDSALVLDISQYIISGDLITVHAVDFAGNQSNTVLITPPPQAFPPQPNNITPDGQGELIDHLTGDDGIEFFTINSRAGNNFYLVIDHTRSSNNVYFLNAVTEWDLIRLAEDAELAPPPHISPPMPIIIIEAEESTPEPTPAPEPPPQTSSGIDGKFLIIGVFVLVGGGVIAYVKFIKPKQGGYGEEQDEYEDYEGEIPEDFEQNEEWEK